MEGWAERGGSFRGGVPRWFEQQPNASKAEDPMSSGQDGQDVVENTVDTRDGVDRLLSLHSIQVWSEAKPWEKPGKAG